MHNTRRSSIAAAIGGPLVGALVLTLSLATAPKAEADSPHVRQPTLRACASDEGESPYPCAWYAPAMGNGTGHSFRIYRDGRVKTISHRRAFALLGECDSDGPLYC